MILRHAAPADAGTIAAIHAASWRDAYASIMDPAYLAGELDADRLAVWSERLAEPRDPQLVLIAIDDGDPVGFICVFGNRDPEWGALVDNLHVLRGARGKGFGRLLLGAGAAWVADTLPGSSIYLWVFEANDPARRFYEQAGGLTVGSEPSSMRGAAGQPELRIHWPSPRLLAERCGVPAFPEVIASA